MNTEQSGLGSNIHFTSYNFRYSTFPIKKSIGEKSNVIIFLDKSNITKSVQEIFSKERTVNAKSFSMKYFTTTKEHNLSIPVSQSGAMRLKWVVRVSKDKDKYAIK